MAEALSSAAQRPSGTFSKSGCGGEAGCTHMHSSGTSQHIKNIKGVYSISKPACGLPTMGVRGTGAAVPLVKFR